MHRNYDGSINYNKKCNSTNRTNATNTNRVKKHIMNTDPKRILIVDDSLKDVELAKAALADNKLLTEVVVAEDGVEAMDYLHKRGMFAHEIGNPDFIMLDIKMPKMNGIEVLKLIRSEPQLMYIPIIMVTSSREERDVVECYKWGANSYIVKPVDIGQFMNTIQILGQYWATINQPPPIFTKSN